MKRVAGLVGRLWLGTQRGLPQETRLKLLGKGLLHVFLLWIPTERDGWFMVLRHLLSLWRVDV